MHNFRQLLFGTLILTLRYRITNGQNGTIIDESRIELTIPTEMKITSWNDMPFSGLVKENGTWIGKGYAFYLLQLLSSKLNFTYTIVPPKNDVLGNSQNGILNLLYEKKVDMAVAFLPVLPELQRYCTFSITLDQSEMTALMKRPQESASGSGLLMPFDQTVWLLVLASIFFIGLVIYISAVLRVKLWKNPDYKDFGLLSYMWVVYGSLLKQGMKISATSDSIRILFATWWMFVLILTSFYTANLTAFLTKPQFTLPINSLQDIVQKGYQWVTYEGRTIQYLLSLNHPNELMLSQTGKLQDHYVTTYEYPAPVILNIVDNNRLFLGEAHYLQTLIFEDYINKSRLHLEHQKRCTYVIMPGTILATSRAFAFPVGSALVTSINKELMALVESGIIKQAKLKDLPLAEVCPVDLQSTERQLTNTDLSLTYKVVVGGYAIAMVVFAIEITIKCVERARKRQKTSGKWYDCTTNNRERGMRGEQDRATPRLVYVTKNRSFDDRITLQKRIPQPLHQNVQRNLVQGKKHCINGRDYYVVIDRGGDQRFIPIRTPSALLFHYRE